MAHQRPADVGAAQNLLDSLTYKGDASAPDMRTLPAELVECHLWPLVFGVCKQPPHVGAHLRPKTMFCSYCSFSMPIDDVAGCAKLFGLYVCPGCTSGLYVSARCPSGWGNFGSICQFCLDPRIGQQLFCRWCRDEIK